MSQAGALGANSINWLPLLAEMGGKCALMSLDLNGQEAPRPDPLPTMPRRSRLDPLADIDQWFGLSSFGLTALC